MPIKTKFRSILQRGKLASALLGLALIACSPTENKKEDKIDMTNFNLAEFFSGDVSAVGFVQDRSGKIIRTFTADVNGKFTPTGLTGTLDETFKWSDGEVEKRTWTLKRTSDTSWVGSADDVVGEAVGTITEDKLRWSYTLTLNVKNRAINFKFDDQMWLSKEGVLVNHAKFSKLGIHLGDVVVSFTK